jgi:hypothetical protein
MILIDGILQNAAKFLMKFSALYDVAMSCGIHTEQFHSCRRPQFFYNTVIAACR